MALPHPPLLLITDRQQSRRPLVDVVAASLDAGCRWISVREKDLGETEQIALIEALRPFARRHDARLTLHGTAALALRAGTDGVHLSSGSDVEAARAMLGPGALIGVSIHHADELPEVVGADCVIAGPAYATASKPGYGPALAPAGIVGFVRGIPVIAIGGIAPANVAPLRLVGAAGIAVMGGVMRADDPGGEVRAMIAALANVR